MIPEQETFDTIVNGLRQQGCQSVRISEHGTTYCLYRGDNGAKCAAGILLPDEEYISSMEGFDAARYMTCASALGTKTYCNRKGHIPTLQAVGKILYALGHNIQLVSTLQLIHDSYWGQREELWEAVAKEWDLVYTPVA